MDKSTQNKFSVVIEMLKLAQLKNESTLDFKVRLEAAFRKIEDLDVKISDLKVICFLNGLLSKYSSIVNTLSVQTTSFTLDDTLKQLNSFESRGHTDQNYTIANVASSGGEDGNGSKSMSKATKKTDSTEDSTTDLNQKLNNMKAMIGQLKNQLKKSNDSYSNSKSNRNKRQFDKVNDSSSNEGRGMSKKELDDKYGRKAAPFEKSGTCKNCNTPGHHVRTCNKKARNSG